MLKKNTTATESPLKNVLDTQPITGVPYQITQLVKISKWWKIVPVNFYDSEVFTLWPCKQKSDGKCDISSGSVISKYFHTADLIEILFTIYKWPEAWRSLLC